MAMGGSERNGGGGYATSLHDYRLAGGDTGVSMGTLRVASACQPARRRYISFSPQIKGNREVLLIISASASSEFHETLYINIFAVFLRLKG